MEKQATIEKDLYVIGCGGFGREVAWLVERINENRKQWNLKGFIDDGVAAGTKIGKYQVCGDTNYLIENVNDSFLVCAIGSPKVRKKIVDKLKVHGFKNFAILVDPSVILSDTVDVGEGSIICAGCILTVDINIGNHVIVNLDSTVGHDVIISDFCTVYPGVNISGQVRLDKYVQVGTGAAILQGLSIGSGSFVGAGATVTKSFGPSNTIVGTPARIRLSKSSY